MEHDWFSVWRHGREPAPLWHRVDEDEDPDWARHSAAEHLLRLREDTVARSRADVAEAFDDGGLGRRTRCSWPDGRSPSLRWLLVHMIEEYARHNVGRTGE